MSGRIQDSSVEEGLLIMLQDIIASRIRVCRLERENLALRSIVQRYARGTAVRVVPPTVHKLVYDARGKILDEFDKFRESTLAHIASQERIVPPPFFSASPSPIPNSQRLKKVLRKLQRGRLQRGSKELRLVAPYKIRLMRPHVLKAVISEIETIGQQWFSNRFARQVIIKFLPGLKDPSAETRFYLKFLVQRGYLEYNQLWGSAAKYRRKPQERKSTPSKEAEVRDIQEKIVQERELMNDLLG